jgi:hypothetical protein
MVPDYTYPGQWFDDMGMSVFNLDQSPILGVDLNTSPGLNRGDVISLTRSLRDSGFDAYGGE